jgi:hypothetical protein
MQTGWTPAHTPMERQLIVGGVGLLSTTPSQSLSWPSQISTPPLVFWHAVSQPGTVGERS